MDSIARCGCAGFTGCACLVAVTGALSITGSGGASNQYVIDGPHLAGNPASPLDVEVAGAGTEASPWLISVEGDGGGGGGGGAVDSVNGETGDVVLSAADVGAATTAALDAEVTARTAAIQSSPGAGAYTSGSVVKVGGYATNRRFDLTGDAGTSYVAGGAPNYENVIGGNTANVDTGTSNLTGAAALTAENGNWNFLLGGYDTVVNGWANSIVGFHSKVEAGANHCTFGGGSRNSAAAATAYGTVGGGTTNSISGNNPTVGGGNTNQAVANGATVAGGTTNTANNTVATVGGGAGNTASNANATVGGGSGNTASGNSATVPGGLTCSATGTAATAFGRENTAVGANSLATGRGAVTVEEGQHAHASTAFATPGDAQLNRWALKKQTTDATQSNLEASVGTPPTIPADTTWAFRALVVARRTDVDGENAAWEVKGLLKRDAGNTGALVGTPTVTAIAANGGNTWALAVSSQSAGTLLLRVTGEAAKTIRWVAELNAASVSG